MHKQGGFLSMHHHSENEGPACIRKALDGEKERGRVVSFNQERRSFLRDFVSIAAGSGGSMVYVTKASAIEKEDFSTILNKVKEARNQLDPIPTLIQEEKWDSVRAILITPPLSDCWAKTAKPLLVNYAEQIGELPDGDELAALEFKEEALDHLRFLDMAVYNNVFNPIKTEGETGASKELIKSYYEDPKREYETCVRIFNGLISLATP